MNFWSSSATAPGWKHILKIDTNDAIDVTGLDAAAVSAAAVSKQAVPEIDLVAMLAAAGIAPADIPSKLEVLALGGNIDRAGQTYHMLYVSDDNDFLPAISGDNHFHVFGFTDAELPDYVPQALASQVPEPAT